MRVPLRWLRDFVEISLPPQELAHRLTMAGIEVGSVDDVGDEWERIVIGRVLEVERHSGADNLFVAKIDVGETITLVTAAPNLQVGFVVPVVRPGGRLGPDRAIEARRFRGIMSEGMLCSGAELGVSADDKQIYVLEPEAPIGVALVDYLGDAVLEVELTPNRPDCLGILGIAREVSAITGAPLTLPWERQLDGRTGSSKSSSDAASPLTVLVEDPDLCPRYTGRYLENIRIEASPQWLQRRLHLAGVRPISNVVDITNYVMLEVGQPLHAFDADLVDQTTIRVRRARPSEKITTIDGTERELTTEMLVIADAAKPVALAGIMGGSESEIGETTTRVILESATFSGTSIRRTSRGIHLASEASKRFDKGLDVELPVLASDRAVALLAQLAGALPVGHLVDVRTSPPAPRQVMFSSSDIARLIGHTYDDDQIEGILSRLGFGLQRTADDFDAVVPSWRGDVEGKADIAEEIARIVGYDAIPTVLPSGQLPSTQEEPAIRWEAIVRGSLARAGLQEVITYSLVDPFSISRLDPTSDYPNGQPDEDTIAIANPQSVERSHLRRTLLPSLLSTLASNLRHEDRVAIFESSRVFLPPLDPLPREERRLAIVMAGRRAAAEWNADTDELDFYDLKAAVEAAFEAVHLPFALTAFAAEPWLHSGRAAAITIEGEAAAIGFMGQVHPTVAARFDIDDVRVYAAEIELDALLTRARDQLVIRPISRFPAVTRDLALVVEKAVTHEQAVSVIRDAAGPLLEGVSLFDMYSGQGIPDGSVSLAYSMRFRAPDRTLEDQEVNTVMTNVEQRVGEALGAHIRGR